MVEYYTNSHMKTNIAYKRTSYTLLHKVWGVWTYRQDCRTDNGWLYTF